MGHLTAAFPPALSTLRPASVASGDVVLTMAFALYTTLLLRVGNVGNFSASGGWVAETWAVIAKEDGPRDLGCLGALGLLDFDQFDLL